MTVAEITSQALLLSEGDRAEILGRLIDSMEVHGPDPHDFDADSLTEAIHRSNELKLGLVKPISEEELWRSVNASRGR